jgi:hypothetical protein
MRCSRQCCPLCTKGEGAAALTAHVVAAFIPRSYHQHSVLKRSGLTCLRFAKTSLGEIRTKDKSSAKEIIRRNILHPIIDVQIDDVHLQYYSRQ